MMTGAVVAVAAAALTSCDNVAEDDRFIKLPPIEADRSRAHRGLHRPELS